MTLLKTNLNREDDVLRNKTLLNPIISNPVFSPAFTTTNQTLNAPTINSPTFSPLLLWNNTTLSKTAAYQVKNSDRGKTLALSGNALFSLTFDRAAEIYAADFMVRVVNKDAWGTGRAKRIVSTDGDFSLRFLWPGQTVTVAMSNGTLVCDPAFERARLPGGVTTFNVKNGTGSDTLGDGLGNDAGAWNLVSTALYNIGNFFDYSSSPQSQVVVQMRADEIGNPGAHLSLHSLAPGAQGGAALTLDGGNFLYSTTNACLDLFHGVVLAIRNIKLKTTANVEEVKVQRTSYLYITEGVEFQGNAGSFSDFAAVQGGTIELGADFSISVANGRGALLTNDSSYIFVSAPITVTLNHVQNVAAWIIAQDPGATHLENITWVNSFVVTGPQKLVQNNAVLVIASAIPLPGTTAGSVATGGQFILS